MFFVPIAGGLVAMILVIVLVQIIWAIQSKWQARRGTGKIRVFVNAKENDHGKL